MSEKSKNLPAPVSSKESKETKALKRQKRFSLNLEPVLKREKFHPIAVWIRDVFPALEPKDQSDAILKLLPYLYPTYKPLSAEPEKKSGSKVTTNIQVNVPGGSSSSQSPQISSPNSPLTLDALYQLAKTGLPESSDPTDSDS